MTVSHILRRKGSAVVSARRTDTLGAVAQTLAQHRIGAVIVLDGGRVEGILSERDIVRALAAHGAAALETAVSQAMTADVVSCSPRDSVETVMERMTRGRFRHMPVMDGETLAGMISIGDIVKERIDEAVAEAASLREYVSSAG
jgi:CBS domain-containing protein